MATTTPSLPPRSLPGLLADRSVADGPPAPLLPSFCQHTDPQVCPSLSPLWSAFPATGAFITVLSGVFRGQSLARSALYSSRNNVDSHSVQAVKSKLHETDEVEISVRVLNKIGVSSVTHHSVKYGKAVVFQVCEFV